ncbi:hypothetical protein [Photobacterium sp. TLY01]|uniref:hypothetical protein n=1 Tax=Photobacterium sp. TLY01 TaxID=2907534 RepID=UPI001F39E511|nr:hypothetical protein [Photobacterium sp. TLY01]UIP27266.1 hypothetical protein LN341_11580 [Photobacterium sp. TLY01]
MQKVNLSLVLILMLAGAARAQVYPSTGSAWVTPGGWEEPLSTSRFDSAEAVRRWELRHADLVLGDWQSAALNDASRVLLPFRAQSLSCEPDAQQRWLAQQARATGLDPESAFLHFAQDTRLAVKDTHQQLDSLLQTRPWLSRTADTLSIPGWDPANDTDNNGQLSDAEYQQRRNPQASARFPSQARVLVTGRQQYGGCEFRTNFSDPDVRAQLINWYRDDWQQMAAEGGYTPRLRPLLGPDVLPVVSGGQILELSLQAGTPEAEARYLAQLVDFLGQLKQQLSPAMLGVSTSGLALWPDETVAAPLRSQVDLWVRPRFLTPAMGLARIQQSWQHFALSAEGAGSVLMVSIRDGHSYLHPGDERAWQQDVETGLALYYLFNLPGQTYYHNWGDSLSIDSTNTSMRDWHRPGLPKNWVYQPTAMLKVDLGEPVSAPKGYKPVWWQAEPLSGDSRGSVLGSYKVVPAHWFWLYRTGWFGKQPSEGVIGRRYAQGLVLYRAVQQAGQSRFLEAKPMRISLPGTYIRVFYDGTTSEPMNYIELGGYEGAVLQKAESEE